jgi:hypothetical protein
VVKPKDDLIESPLGGGFVLETAPVKDDLGNASYALENKISVFGNLTLPMDKHVNRFLILVSWCTDSTRGFT